MILVLASIAFVSGSVGGCDPAISAAPGKVTEHHLDRGANGLWMRRVWIHGGEPTDPARLATELRALSITRVYPFLGPMDPDGWPGWRREGTIVRYEPELAGAFFAAMRAEAPEVSVLPWTGGNLEQDVHLDDAAQRTAFAEHARRLVALGAAGVHVNVEPMPSGRAGYLALLRAVSAAIGEGTLSIAAYPPITPLHPYASVHWSIDFTREVCLVADELAVMAYDTALDDPGAYEGLVAQWTRELRAALPTRADGGCDLVMGVPAYEDDEPWHRPDAETIERGLRGVIAGARAGEGRAVDGVAIYASWTTDAEEWATYERLWLERAPRGATVSD